ncbi:MAG: LysM peptidoglycan-binding domain-containing protein [Acidobacteria bacterium]|nr:LysM peptidoglycan-binding domain-containing protein [Acidobacteriota bacterium]
MKKKHLFFTIILIVLLFCRCSGSKSNIPATEPLIPVKETEKAPPVNPGEEKKTPEVTGFTEKEEIIPKTGETIPGIIPVMEIKQETGLETPAASGNKSPETPTTTAPDPNLITDHITSGISSVFKEFGYSGDVDVPESFKNRVAHYIRYFSFDHKGSRFYQRSMNRAAEYLPMIRQVFEEKNLPLSLVYLALVESGFNPNARSRVGAVGMWQFMRGTARNYGLTVSRRVDERKNPARATAAAAEYLDDLLAMFGMEDPFLGICAYNAGEGKILNCLRKISYKERSFWTLVRKNLLHTETDEYIPRLLAVILMSQDPQLYAAAAKNVSVEANDTEDQEIIDEIHTAVAPASGEEMTVEAEPGTEPTNEQETVTETGTEPTAQTAGEPVWVYQVKRGDTLFSIAKKYNVTVNDLLEWNQLDSNLLQPGQELKFYTAAPKIVVDKPIAASPAKKAYKLIYTVNYKDTLARIALFFKGVTVSDIMRWNGLKRTRIYLKQELAIYLNQPPRKIAPHVVKNGETVVKIARKYDQRLEYVLSLNGMVTDSPLAPGKRLQIYYF